MQKELTQWVRTKEDISGVNGYAVIGMLWMVVVDQ